MEEGGCAARRSGEHALALLCRLLSTLVFWHFGRPWCVQCGVRAFLNESWSVLGGAGYRLRGKNTEFWVIIYLAVIRSEVEKYSRSFSELTGYTMIGDG